MVELECKALCGNPNVYTYNWFWSNDSSMTQIGQNSIFSYTLNATSINDTFSITCTIENGVTTTENLDESQTVFNIIHSNKITTSGKFIFYFLKGYHGVTYKFSNLTNC